MSDDFFSVTDPEENKKSLYRLNNSFAAEKWTLVYLAAEAVIFAITYFNKSYVTDADGDAIGSLLYALGLLGFLICKNIIEFFRKSSGTNIEDESTIDAEFMGTYKYTSSQDSKWFTWGISAAAGGLNVVIYLAFLVFVAK